MPPRQTTLLFHTLTPGVSRGALREFGEKLAEQVVQGGSFSCLITGDRELRRLNREFRQCDYATDVLSFPSQPEGRLEPTLPVAGNFLGDIAISFDRAKAQAAEYGHDAADEIRILMLHGLLHLAGYDHETDRGRMARAERKWRAALGLPRGLIERVRP